LGYEIFEFMNYDTLSKRCTEAKSGVLSPDLHNQENTLEIISYEAIIRRVRIEHSTSPRFSSSVT
jgi:hypothetical protein